MFDRKCSGWIRVFVLAAALLPASLAMANTVDLEIEMPCHVFWPGSDCWLDLHLTNTTGDALEMAQLFLALNVGTETFWFYPEWTVFPGEIDWVWVDLDPYAADTYIILPEFSWPDECGCFDDARFLGVLVHDGMMLSNLDEFPFGWTETTPTPSTPTPTVTPTPTPWPDGYVYVPPGSVFVGSPGNELCHQSEEVLHQVNITHGLMVKQYEVTQKEWLSLFGELDLMWEHPNYPMYAMTWYDACAFCNRLSIVSGLTPCYYNDPDFITVFDGDPPIVYGPVFWDRDADGFRLPTESEWEFFCRAGHESPYNNGRRNTECYGVDPNLDPLAWYSGNSNGRPHTIYSKEPNAIGLYHAHGNAGEWCWDYYGEYPEGPVDDPVGPETGDYRVFRGGNFGESPMYCRSAARYSTWPASTNAGLRCVCEGYPQPTWTPATPPPGTPTPTGTPTPEQPCHHIVAAFPYYETFDAGMGYWMHSQYGDINWIRTSGPTGSSGTGPPGDHTSGSGYYLYTEASSFYNCTAILYGICFDTSQLTIPTLSFYYHMYGYGMGTLAAEVTVNNGNTWTTVFSQTGDQGNQWHLAEVDLTAWQGEMVGVRFVGTTGSHYTSDMAIDDILFRDGMSPPPPTNTPVPTWPTPEL